MAADGANTNNAARWTSFLIVLVFLGAAAFYITAASFVAADGRRYFCIDDDALISLRYARNLAHGHGLVWNVGERVEGFTDMLWTLYAAIWAIFIPRRLLPLGMQASGVALLGAHAFVFARIIRDLSAKRGETHPWREVAAMALPFAYGPLFYWSIEGLEVCLVGFLISLAVLLYLRGRLFSVAIALGLAFWTRPDCAIPAAIIMGTAGFDVLRDRDSRRHWIDACLVLVMIALALFALRRIYYGHSWPNTYVLKMRHFPLLDRVRLNGIGYITPFLQEHALPLGLALLALAFGWTRIRALFAMLIAAMTAYAVYVGGDALPHWRLIAPVVPFTGLILLTDGPAARTPSRLRAALRILAMTLLFADWAVTSRDVLREMAEGPMPIERANIETAVELNRLLEPAATLGVLHAGSIPYYTDFRAYDFLGKCDPVIARLKPDLEGPPRWGGMITVPGHNKHDLHQSIRLHRPTFIESYWWGNDSAADYATRNYEAVPTTISTPFSGNYLLLLKNSPLVRWSLIHLDDGQPPTPHEGNG